MNAGRPMVVTRPGVSSHSCVPKPGYSTDRRTGSDPRPTTWKVVFNS